ncbi:hypothetical protein TraAM80_04623 [Trypanosoma rangeli]|uniref:Choline transporter-like protein n=1 Tax=Trypanosoma rangeli TaxID=5698 RepID=A0A3S5IRA1_TRYRA|nr:uncharacterized protein TraAM80_04623 [Trypanosoma rangeli]RNF05413.1 hypothetical protein TraAM80_04623 [Trypanosoma rangeli]|eukprot:RNF05413.1 hypothetical protein TraAM80_04623 [Trypanosoma rangeli]
MDQDLKSSKYKAYNLDMLPQAEIYNQPGGNFQGSAVNGVPLYPDETPGNPRLSRFVVQGYQDLWAGVLFVIVLILSVVWGAVNMTTYVPIPLNTTHHGAINIDHDNVNFSAFVLLFVIFAVSVIGACCSLVLLGMFPRQLIFIANVLTAVLTLVGAVVSFISGIVGVGVVLVIVCIFQAVWLYLVRDRIMFSAELLKAASDVLTKYKAVFFFSFIMSALSLLYMVFWFAMCFPSVDRMNFGYNNTGDSLLFTFCMLLLFWVSQVVANIIHVTTSGVTATWYFAGEGRMPQNPTLASFKRATTTSLGSICFGSLMVAIVRLLRWLAESATDNENEFIRCITVCILSCLESMLEYFNLYAFVHVAVYGCGYIEAAKRTWQLCKQCFFAAYFNDALVGSTLNLLSLGVSALIGVVVGLAYLSTAVGAIAFLGSMIVHVLFFSAVESAVTTIFVCFAEVPEGLQHSAPELYAALHYADQGATNNNAPSPVV